MGFAESSAKLSGSLHAMGTKTDAAEKRILDAAMKRDAAARARMDELRPVVLTQAGAAREYQALALELRRLALVIEMARRHVKPEA